MSASIVSDESTAVKFKIEITSQQEEYFRNCFSYMREISFWLHEKIKDRQITKLSSFSLVFSNGDEVSDRQFKYLPEIKQIIEKYFGSEVYGSNIDAINWSVVRMYKSYIGRNSKKMKNAISIRPKSFATKANVFQFDKENNVLLMQKVEKDKSEPHLSFNITECTYSNSNLLSFTRKKFPNKSNPQGGVLCLKNNQLVLLAKMEVEYPIAEKTIGIDINKSNDNWLAWSEKIPSTGEKRLPKPTNVFEIEQNIKALQKKITGKDESDILNSRKRKGVRKKWTKAHNKHAIQVELIVNKILDEFKDVYGEFNVGIDTVATKHGSFGNDKVIAAIANWCKTNKHAYIYVPTPNTSRRCSECGQVSLSARQLNIYTCKTCSHVEQADENAAKNIELFADAIIGNGFRMIGTLKSSYKWSLMRFLNDFFKLKDNVIA